MKLKYKTRRLIKNIAINTLMVLVPILIMVGCAMLMAMHFSGDQPSEINVISAEQNAGGLVIVILCLIIAVVSGLNKKEY